MSSLWEWFGSIPWWVRLSISGVLILISTVLYFSGTFWPWGWAVGFVLLCLGGPSDSEKKGYRF